MARRSTKCSRGLVPGAVVSDGLGGMLKEGVISEMRQPGRFWSSVGIEDTFLPARSPTTACGLDLYELTGHYERWADDVDLMAGLGVPVVRYGLPWPWINPVRGQWDR
jgi:beta-glucosidase